MKFLGVQRGKYARVISEGAEIKICKLQSNKFNNVFISPQNIILIYLNKMRQLQKKEKKIRI